MKIVRILGTLALTALCAVGLPAQRQQNTPALRQAIVRANNRVIVTMKPTTSEGASLRRRGEPVIDTATQTRIERRLGREHRLNVRKQIKATSMIVADVDANQLSALLADSNVAYVEPDILMRPAETYDLWTSYAPRAQETPYGITQVTAPQVWATGNRGQGVKVAVLDSGIDPNHPDLTVVGGYNSVARADTGWADNIAPCNGHGTHIAGTIAAKDNDIGVVGVVPNAQLYAIKVFENLGGSCLAYTSSQIVGLNWAVTQGIKVVNVSIGGSGSSYSYNIAIQNAAAAGTFVVASAGNNGGTMLSPGNSPLAFGIGAVDGNNNRASWSSYGAELDFMSPGVGITSTMPGGGYGSKSGTSMAAPHAVGVIALIIQANPTITRDELQQKLLSGALDLETPGFNTTTGYGLTRAFNSLGGIVQPPPCTPIALVSAAPRIYNTIKTDSIQVTGSCPWTATSSRSNVIIRGSWVVFTSSAPDTIRVRKQ